jgi:molybdate transport system substrate-binding protein
VRLLLVAALLLSLAGCATSTAPQRETVTVFAAASLTDAFEQIAEDFEDANPGVDIVLSFGGSSALAAQIAEGAPADVFASASTEYLDGAVFATNRLAIAGDAELADFANPDLAIALCAVEVPCGAAAAAMLEREGVIPSVDSYEQDVRAVLTKVELGEVDAGIVYVSDLASSEVVGSPLDSDPIEYPIASLADRGQAFMDFVLSDEGQRILAGAGFGAP